MKRLDYIVVALILFSWASEFVYLIAPKGHLIAPFIFSDKTMISQWYLFLLSQKIWISATGISMYLVKGEKIHYLTENVIKINIICAVYEMFWFVLFYHNPISIPTDVIKIIVVVITYLLIWYLRKKK